MKAGFITHGILSHKRRGIREFSPECIFRTTQVFPKQFVQSFFECFLTTHHRNQCGNIFLDLPEVGPTVVLIVIIPASLTSVKSRIYFYPVSLVILWQKK